MSYQELSVRRTPVKVKPKKAAAANPAQKKPPASQPAE